MNNRIKELVGQASEYVNTVYTPPIRSKTPGKMWEDGHVSWHTQFNQKFAELIVRECCDVVIDSDPSPKMILHEPYRTIMNNIQEHFGVEE